MRPSDMYLWAILNLILYKFLLDAPERIRTSLLHLIRMAPNY